MKIFLVFLITLPLLGCHPSSEVTYEYLVAHQGKTVLFRSKIAEFPEQHPTENMYGHDTVSGKTYKKHATYVNLSQLAKQIVLISKDPINCTDLVETEGIARLVELGGISGKMSYSRIWIDVIRYKCL